MLQRKQNHPLGVTVNITLSSIFLLFHTAPPHTHTHTKNSFTIHFRKKVFMTQQSYQETIRVQKSQGKGRPKRDGDGKEKARIQHILRINPRGNRTSKALSQLPYALTKIPTAAGAQGAVSSLAPHPAVVETHLAPCWTFIRPDSHQMVPCFGSGAVWPCTGGGSHISAQRGAQIGAFLSDRCQGRSGVSVATEAGCKAILYVGILWHETFGKGKKRTKTFKFVFNFTSTENKMEWEKSTKLKAKRKCQKSSLRTTAKS